jgi:hypothetical protein
MLKNAVVANTLVYPAVCMGMVKTKTMLFPGQNSNMAFLNMKQKF